MEYDVKVTIKRFLKNNIVLKGKISKIETTEDCDWLMCKENEKIVTIKLETGKTIKICDDGINFFNRYSIEKI
jgi:hypothetical protein